MKRRLKNILSMMMVVAVIFAFSAPSGAAYAAKNTEMGIGDISYSFENFSKKVPLSVCQFMYGRNTVAKTVYNYDLGTGGNCFGIASTSSMLHVPNDISVKDFNGSAVRNSDLSKSDMNSALGLTIEDFIQAMHVTQVSMHMNYRTVEEHSSDTVTFMDTLENETAAGKPVLLCMFGAVSGGTAGHAIAAYGVESISDSEYKVLVYDNNYPGEERYVYMHKKGSSYSWDYSLTGSIKWGTDINDGEMEYITYDDFYHVWQNHGKLASSGYNLLDVNSDNFTLCDTEGVPVAEVIDGVLDTDNDEIRNVTPMEFNTALPEEEQAAEYTILIVPVDLYILKNNEESDEFEASIVNKELGVTVSTESDEIRLVADDEYDNTYARVNGTDGEAFDISIMSSRLGDASFVEYSGTGDGSSIRIKYVNGNIPMIMGSTSITRGDINTLDLSEAGVRASLSEASYVYDGKAKKPEVTVEVYGETLDSSNYTVEYKNNVKKGTATAVVTGTGNCTGSINLHFDIVNKNAAKKQTKAEEKSKKTEEKAVKKAEKNSKKK